LGLRCFGSWLCPAIAGPRSSESCRHNVDYHLISLARLTMLLCSYRRNQSLMRMFSPPRALSMRCLMTSTTCAVRRLFALLIVLLTCANDWREPAPARALPSGGQVAEGAASIHQPNASSLRIDQASDRALLHWQGFSIGQSETVQFVQPSATSLAVNRILGGDPSIILGRLLANGRVFLLNPNGVIFGAGSVVNVG